MHLLIPAAGVGRRMGSDRNKLLLPLCDRPILAWTLAAAETAREITWIGIISQPHDWEEFKAIARDLNLSKPVHFVRGGDTRQESVYNGLQALPDDASHVLIHDGARCLATPNLFDRCAQIVRTCPGLIAAIPVKDTIKVVNDDLDICDTPDRRNLWAAQTPQGFEVAALKACHDRGRREGWQVTDDAALFEKCDLPVKIVPGEDTNLKVTTPIDLTVAQFVLNHRAASPQIASP